MGILCVFCVYDTLGNRCFEKTSFPKKGYSGRTSVRKHSKSQVQSDHRSLNVYVCYFISDWKKIFFKKKTRLAEHVIAFSLRD